MLVSGENKWAICEGMSGFQRLLEESVGKKLTHFVLDSGRGIVSGVSSMLSAFEADSSDSDTSDIANSDLSDTDEND